MPEIHYLAIAVATVAAFLLSGAWYAALGGQLARLHEAYASPTRPAAANIPVELARNLVVAVVIAALVGQIEVGGFAAAVVLGLVLWVGFPVVLLAGSIFHEKVPSKLAAIHAGDWLVKLLVIAVIVSVWR